MLNSGNKVVDPSEMLDLNDINLRLSENLDYEKNLKQNLAGLVITQDPTASELEGPVLTKCEQHLQDYILFCLKC